MIKEAVRHICKQVWKNLVSILAVRRPVNAICLRELKLIFLSVFLKTLHLLFGELISVINLLLGTPELFTLCCFTEWYCWRSLGVIYILKGVDHPGHHVMLADCGEGSQDRCWCCNWCHKPPPLVSNGFSMRDSFTLSNHLTSLIKTCKLLSSNERPLSLRCN